MDRHASLSDDYKVGSVSSLKAGAHHIPAHISTRGRYFTDSYGRSLLLHGCNVSGLSKLPVTPNGFTHLSEGFFDHEFVNFVGRPFPLDEAHEHFTRLSNWGLTFIRLVITWESLEHEGPGIYDDEYIAYLAELIAMMPKYGIRCYIDAHQDVWSRHTGGSGAPTWTLGIAGLDIRSFKATGAAHAHNLHLEPHDPPPKVWPSGYCKLAAATLATVFWAGDTFAPKTKVKRSEFKGGFRDGETTTEEEVGLQEFLQTCMIEAFGALADKVKDLEAVMGFEVINEPHRGYIELHSPYSWDFKTDLAIGFFPSAAQGWALGTGHPVLIDHYVPSFPVTAKSHQVLLTPPNGRTAWKAGVKCIWEDHGVWAWDPKRGRFGEPVVLKMEYFTKHPETGKEVEWYQDFYWPFCKKFGERIVSVNPTWRTFVGPIPNESLFTKSVGFMSANVQGLARGMFILKALYFGRAGLKKKFALSRCSFSIAPADNAHSYALQIHNIINAGYRSIGEFPVVIGETGVPFDMNDKAAFKTGNFSWQERQMDAICSALESNLVSFNLWNYNPLNNDEWGDSWNSENFSWFSLSDVTKDALDHALKTGGEDARLNVGARVLDAVERPYACKVAGIPTHANYNFRSKVYTFRFANPSPTAASTPPVKEQADTAHPPLHGTPIQSRETEIYLPRRRYGAAARAGMLRVDTRGEGDWKYDEVLQTLYFLHTNTTPEYTHLIRLWIDGEGGAGSSELFEWRVEIALALVVLLFAVGYTNGW
ncbi:glycoside hydrolase family 5 protein [Pseudohyphozyma bogoriensis]|nr:glycoside hydrolase family 5 protein [Pseudohyphozyma bogoriensis]